PKAGPQVRKADRSRATTLVPSRSRMARRRRSSHLAPQASLWHGTQPVQGRTRNPANGDVGGDREQPGRDCYQDGRATRIGRGGGGRRKSQSRSATSRGPAADCLSRATLFAAPCSYTALRKAGS